jgi:hypothetical protein
MEPPWSGHHENRDYFANFEAIFDGRVAPGKASGGKPRSIAKGLTSKSEKLLSKICQTAPVNVADREDSLHGHFSNRSRRHA